MTLSGAQFESEYSQVERATQLRKPDAIVIEDEKHVGDLLQFLVEGCGFTCHRALSSEAAAALVTALRPAVWRLVGYDRG